jgi:hypothetical protein
MHIRSDSPRTLLSSPCIGGARRTRPRRPDTRCSELAHVRTTARRAPPAAACTCASLVPCAARTCARLARRRRRRHSQSRLSAAGGTERLRGDRVLGYKALGSRLRVGVPAPCSRTSARYEQARRVRAWYEQGVPAPCSRVACRRMHVRIPPASHPHRSSALLHAHAHINLVPCSPKA